MNSSDVTAACTIICSALAFVLTIYYAHLARKHQRLLGRTHCHFMALYQDNDDRMAGLYLHNVGPVAVVKQWKFWFNHEFLGKDFNGMKAALIKMGGEKARGTYLEPGDCFPPQAFEKIIWLVDDDSRLPMPQSEKKLFENRLRLLEMELTVESIYNEPRIVSYKISLSGKTES